MTGDAFNTGIGTVLLSNMEGRIHYQETLIIGRLVGAYKSGKLTPEQALSGIGEFSALRTLLAKLYSDTQLAMEKEDGKEPDEERR